MRAVSFPCPEELLRDLIENGSKLEEVRYEMLSAKLICRVFLVFSGGAFLSVSVDEDSDEVIVGEARPEKDATEDASTASPWRGAIGKPLFAAWLMKSYNGAVDAIQLDFRFTVSDEPKLVQMQGIASTLQMGLVVHTT